MSTETPAPPPASTPAPAAAPQSGPLGMAQDGTTIGRQVKLPWSKAFEISLKAVKTRFIRSLITAGGIILAIAFLMATWTRQDVVGALKTGLPEEVKAAQKGLGKLQELKAAAKELPTAGVHLEDSAKRLADFENRDTGVLALLNCLKAMDDAAVQRPQLTADKWVGFQELRGGLVQLAAQVQPTLPLVELTAKWPEPLKKAGQALEVGDAAQALKLMNEAAQKTPDVTRAPNWDQVRKELQGLKEKPSLVQLIKRTDKWPRTMIEIPRAMKRGAVAEAQQLLAPRLQEVEAKVKELEGRETNDPAVKENLPKQTDLLKGCREVQAGLAKLAEAPPDLSGYVAFRQRLEAVTTTSRNLDSVSDALNRANVPNARDGLAKAVEKRPELAQLPPVQAIQAALPELEAPYARLQSLNAMRMELIKRGEALAATEAGTEAGREGAAASSRSLWLIYLALLVAFVGIMNAMLMSVTERFREIGTMKCLGALDAFIVKLFLIESSMQGFLGTLFGALVGLLLSLLSLWSDFSYSAAGFVPWPALLMRVILALVIGTALAFLGALIPAWIAARMEPVVAMRQDQ